MNILKMKRTIANSPYILLHFLPRRKTLVNIWGCLAFTNLLIYNWSNARLIDHSAIFYPNINIILFVKGLTKSRLCLSLFRYPKLYMSPKMLTCFHKKKHGADLSHRDKLGPPWLTKDIINYPSCNFQKKNKYLHKRYSCHKASKHIDDVALT